MNARKNLIGLTAAALLAASSIAVAAPTLIQSPVLIEYVDSEAPSDFRSQNVNVVAGPEVACPDSPFCEVVLLDGDTIDIRQATPGEPVSIVFSFQDAGTFLTASFLGFRFVNLAFDPASVIASLSLVVSGLDGLEQSDVTLNGNTIAINFESVVAAANSSAIIGINTRAIPEPIPEPGTLALLGVGLAALFALRRRSTTSAA